jgi:hypothetical protein
MLSRHPLNRISVITEGPRVRAAGACGSVRAHISTLLSDRRRFLAFFSSMGLSSTLLPGVVWAPSGDPQVLMTNLTRYPACIVPNGFRENGTPVSLTFLGRLFGEAKLLAVARAYQEATDFHLKRPALEAHASETP